jgi:regulatory protein
VRRPKAPHQKSRSSASDAAWTRALRWLAGRDHSVAEVRQRLAGVGVEATTIDATVARLRDYGYLDDVRFAATYAEAAARRGRGSERVRVDLDAKGLTPAMIEATIVAAFTNERELAEGVLASHSSGRLRSPAERAKAARFLLNRGFPEAIVLAIVGEGC